MTGSRPCLAARLSVLGLIPRTRAASLRLTVGFGVLIVIAYIGLPYWASPVPAKLSHNALYVNFR